MTRARIACAAAAAFVLTMGSPARADDARPLRVLDRPLAIEPLGGRARVELSGLFDLETYYIDQRPPGLIFGGSDSFVNPRLSLFLDARFGRRWYAFTEARLDRGFDPRARSSSFRFDQYFLRVAPLADGRVSLQAGKFATVVGNWVARHDSWTNPFVNAPLPYENVLVASDVKAPASPDEFLARRRLADKKGEWLPILWGPSYASGAAVFGRVGDLDYAVEVKNATLSSRPSIWDARQRGFTHPTASGRVGWRPAPAWTVGASLSGGSYFREKAAATLAAGHHVGDYRELLAGVDATYARRHLEVWAELFTARFEVPRVGNADTLAYYVEGRYKITPRLFGALRWNQQVFAGVEDGRDRDRAWDRDAWRVDTALGYRFDRHLQGKLQYSYTHQLGSVQQGEQLFAAQLTLKF